MAHFALHDTENAAANEAAGAADDTAEYKAELSSTLLGASGDAATPASDSKILAFKHKAPAPEESHQNNLRVLYSANREAKSASHANTPIHCTDKLLTATIYL